MAELKTDHLSDIKVFGQDPFHTKPVHTENFDENLLQVDDKGHFSASMNTSIRHVNNTFESQSNLQNMSPGSM